MKRRSLFTFLGLSATAVVVPVSGRATPVVDEVDWSKVELTSGGWCAPSKTCYSVPCPPFEDMFVDMPQISVRRGGIQFPVRS